MTDDLIERLSRDPRPARTGRVGFRLAVGLGIGAALAFAGVALGLGLRPDMARAMASRMFWMKLAYALALAVVGILCVERLARPAGRAGRAAWFAAPVLAIVAIAGMQLSKTPHDAWRNLIMGGSAMVCPWLILLTALPVFAALIWALRGLAPTRPRLAGALAGLTAGAAGAGIYALHCSEVGAPFVAIWYSLGILVPCAVGALAGPRLLRW